MSMSMSYHIVWPENIGQEREWTEMWSENERDRERGEQESQIV